VFDGLRSARQCLRRNCGNEAAELRSASRIAEPIKPPRHTDYASGGAYHPLFAGLSADAASIRAASAILCGRDLRSRSGSVQAGAERGWRWREMANTMQVVCRFSICATRWGTSLT
jgi:hypothetical protein